MTKRLFNETQEISVDIGHQISLMNAPSQVNLALQVMIPMNPNNPDHRGAPTIMREGVIYIDTATLKQLFMQAIDARDPSIVPDVLNLQTAVRNILEKSPLVSTDVRPHDTVPMIDADAIREALRNHPTPPVRPRNTDFAKTTPYTPRKKS